MRCFEQFPENKLCPICNTNTNKSCTLVPIDGTDEGNICEAEVFHVDCIEDIIKSKLRYNKGANIIYYNLNG